MLTAVVTTSHTTGLVQVDLIQAESEVCERTDQNNKEFPLASEDCPELNPIAPEVKEMLWGFGAFVVLLIAIRLWLFPKVRDGMHARYDKIQGDKESAETLTAAARADVAEYEARLTSVRAEAQHKVDAARTTLEAERSEQIGAANERIAERRQVANAEVEAARRAAMGDIESAVTDVVGRATEIVLGKPASASTVQSAVRSTMGATTSPTAGAPS